MTTKNKIIIAVSAIALVITIILGAYLIKKNSSNVNSKTNYSAGTNETSSTDKSMTVRATVPETTKTDVIETQTTKEESTEATTQATTQAQAETPTQQQTEKQVVQEQVKEPKQEASPMEEVEEQEEVPNNEPLPLDPDYKINIGLSLGNIKNRDSSDGGECPYELYKETTRIFYNQEGESQYLIGFYTTYAGFMSGLKEYRDIRDSILAKFGTTVNDSTKFGGMNVYVGDYDCGRVDFKFFYKR